MTNPTFWPISPEATAVQVHCKEDAKALKPLEPKRIAWAAAGDRLEVFEIARSLESGANWLLGLLPSAKEVYGGEA